MNQTLRPATDPTVAADCFPYLRTSQRRQRHGLKTTCLINNYNYGQFLPEAVASVLRQSHPLTEIIVVDDGSTDDSVAWFEREYADCPMMRLITQPNGGQLSAFETGFAHAQGEVIFFLDADDVWEPDYVACVLDVYQSNARPDFVFTALREFGPHAHPRRDTIARGRDQDCGYSIAAVSQRRPWIGAPTSALSMRRWVLEKIFPIPYKEDWRTRADDCLVFGSSLVGARKYYLASPLVGYRIHGANHFCGRPYDRIADYRRKLAVNRLVKLLLDRMGWDAEELGNLAHREFMTRTSPTWRELRQYCRITIRSSAPWTRRIGRVVEMLAYWLRHARRPSRGGADGP